MGAPLESCGIEHGFSKRLGARPGRASLASVLAAEFASVMVPAKFVPLASLSNDGTALATLNPAEEGVPNRSTTIAIPQGRDAYHPWTHEPSFPNGCGVVLPPSPKGPPWVPRRPGLDESAAIDSSGYSFLKETGRRGREGGDGDSLPMNETARAHFGESARDDARMMAEVDSRDSSASLASARFDGRPWVARSGTIPPRISRWVSALRRTRGRRSLEVTVHGPRLNKEQAGNNFPRSFPGGQGL
jgi:hypothetical protein